MPRARRLFEVCTTTGEWAESPPRWEDEYMRTITCEACLRPSKTYGHHAVPQYIMKRPTSAHCLVMNTTPHILSESLAATLEPYFHDVAWGPVYLERDELIGPLAYRSFCVKADRCIDMSRGPFGRHRLCACDRVIPTNPNAKRVVLKRSLDERMIYSDVLGNLAIDGQLVEHLSLPERFPSLMLYPIKIIDEPMDGDVLPGDPGWDGTLFERPIEVPPDYRTSKFFKKWSY